MQCHFILCRKNDSNLSQAAHVTWRIQNYVLWWGSKPLDIPEIYLWDPSFPRSVRYIPTHERSGRVSLRLLPVIQFRYSRLCAPPMATENSHVEAQDCQMQTPIGVDRGGVPLLNTPMSTGVTKQENLVLLCLRIGTYKSGLTNRQGYTICFFIVSASVDISLARSVVWSTVLLCCTWRLI